MYTLSLIGATLLFFGFGVLLALDYLRIFFKDIAVRIILPMFLLMVSIPFFENWERYEIAVLLIAWLSGFCLTLWINKLKSREQ